MAGDTTQPPSKGTAVIGGQRFNIIDPDWFWNGYEWRKYDPDWVEKYHGGKK